MAAKQRVIPLVFPPIMLHVMTAKTAYLLSAIGFLKVYHPMLSSLRAERSSFLCIHITSGGIISYLVGKSNILFYLVVYFLWVITMKHLKVKISITVDEPILKAMQDLSDRYDKSVSSCINVILREYLKDEKNAGRLPLP